MKLIQRLMTVNLVENELGAAHAARLTARQKALLLQIHMAPTAELAFSATTGSVENVQTRISLHTLGLILVDEASERAGLSDAGQESLTTNNLIDDLGEVTEDGHKLMGDDDTVTTESWLPLMRRV